MKIDAFFSLRFFLALTLAAAVALTGGCASAPQQQDKPSTAPKFSAPPVMDVLVVSDQDNGATVALPLRKKLTVRLAANATTGYTWRILEMDARFLETLSQAYEAPVSSRTGEGGTSVLTFGVLMEGTTRLTLAYQRPWEPEPIRTFSVTLRIATP